MKKQPVDYTNRANLGLNVANNWAAFFPNYTVNFCTQASFLQLFTDFSAQVMLNTQQDSLKKTNTENLKAVNAQIRKSLVRLKEYIRDAYTTNIDSVYAAYGLEKDEKGTYTFPKDNDRLSQRLTILLQKLNEPNNPLENRTQGLVYWQALITEHTTEWTTSKSLKSQKSQLSENCKTLHTQAGEWLSKLYKQLAIDHEKNKVDTIRRTFGFLNETYK